MKKLTLLLIITTAFFSLNLYSQDKLLKYEKSQTKMFPPPKEGYKQVIINLPVMSNEDKLKVEVFAGMDKLVDCNRYFFKGAFTEENLEGWGYTYYTVSSDGELLGTRMACPDDKKIKKFIHLPSQLLRYNSKLPIVIYLPKEFEVEYRLWRADKKTNRIKN